MKKIAIFVFIFLLAFIFVACNGLSSTTFTTTDTSTDTDITTNPNVSTETTTSIDLSGYELRNGLFSFYNESDEFKEIYFEAIDEYLFDNLYAGVPLYSEYIGSFLYSDRVNLPLSEFDSEILYGDLYGSLNTDDSHHIMYDGEYGNIGEYTLRFMTNTYINVRSLNNQATWYTSDLFKLINQSGYEKRIVEGGAEDVSGLFDGDPVPSDINSEMGLVLTAYTWQFKVKEGLSWYYHPDFDTSSLGLGHAVLDANDFLESYKYALIEDNFTGDYLQDINVLNVGPYVFDPTEEAWENVGIKLIDDLTFELTFEEYYSLNDIKAIFKNQKMTPINMELFNLIGYDYGMSPVNMAYSGDYYIDEMDLGVFYSLKKIPGKGAAYDGLEIYTNINPTETQELYNAGKLDIIYNIDDYNDSVDNYPEFNCRINGKYSIEYGIGFNGFSSDEIYQENNPGSSFKIEPIISSLNFRKALYLAINREDLSLLAKGVNLPKTGYYGSDVLDGFNETFGYDADSAREYFHASLIEMSEYYESGDTIVLEVWDFLEIFDLLEVTLEEILYDEELDISVDLVKINPYDLDDIDTYDPAFMSNWLINKIYSRKYDLVFKSFEFSDLEILDEFLFLNSGFPLNEVEVLIEYDVFEFNENFDIINTLEIKEAWSIQALGNILNKSGLTLISDGKIAEEIKVKILEVTPFSFKIDINGLDSEYLRNVNWGVMYPYLGFERWEMLEYDSLEDGIVSYNNLLPGYFGFYIDYELVYENQEESYPNPSFMIDVPYLLNNMLIDDVLVSGDTAEIYLYQVDRNRNFEEGSIVVYQDGFEEENIVACSVEYIGDMAVVSGLDPDSLYFFTYRTDDDFSSYSEEDVSAALRSFIIT
jgi:hypothetical protein